MRIHISLRSVLMLSCILAAVLPMLIVGYISLRSLTGSMEQEITEKNFLLAKSLAGEVEKFLEEPLNRLKHIEDAVDNTPVIPVNLTGAYLDSVVESYPIFERIEILDHDGIVIHAAPGKNTFGYSMSGQPFFRAANELQRPYWSPTFLSLQTDQPTLTLSVPFKKGMVVGYVNLATLNAITDKVTIGLEGYAAIVDREGVMIAHPNRSFVSERFNVTNLEMIRMGLAGEEGSSRYQFEGVNKLGSVAIISHTGWLLMVQQPVEEAFAPVTALRNIILGGIAAALLLAVTIALVSLRVELHPFSRLTESAKKIAEGHYSVSLPQKSYQEIDDLANAFTVMSEAVKNREEALRESEEKYRALFENVNEGFALLESIVDERGVPIDYTFLEINPALEAMTGLERAKVIGKTVRDIFPGIEQDPADWIGRYGNVALTGEGINFESYFKPLGRWFQVNAFSPGKGYFAVTCTDVTGRKAAEDALRRFNMELDRRVMERTAQLEAANKELEAFAYSVSHDLRAPLRHIDGFLGLLQQSTDGSLDERSQHYMTTIANAAKRMGMLIDDLLSFSRMGRRELTSMPVDLSALVREAIRELEPDTASRGIRWRIAELPVVTGDRAMLRMVFANLIANAVKFTRPRDQTEVEIGCQTGQDGETVVYVRDNGVGFDMQYADKLFGVFQRLHRVEDFEGTGIGLANVRRIIARHGGRVWAEGTVDQGATFYFSLPHTTQGG